VAVTWVVIGLLVCNLYLAAVAVSRGARFSAQLAVLTIRVTELVDKLDDLEIR